MTQTETFRVPDSEVENRIKTIQKEMALSEIEGGNFKSPEFPREYFKYLGKKMNIILI